MNTRLSQNQIAALAIIIVVIGGGAWYFSTAHRAPQAATPLATPSPPAAATTSPTPATKSAAPARPTRPRTPQPARTEPVVISGYSSISYLLSLKQSLSCTVDAVAAGARRTGTIYVAGGKMRGDFSGLVNGVAAKTSMIDNGTRVYVWTDGATTGLELLAASSVNGSVIASHGGIALSSDFSFACSRWTEDQNLFVPPPSVTFSNTF